MKGKASTPSLSGFLAFLFGSAIRMRSMEAILRTGCPAFASDSSTL
jgi:hypothetical protein